MPGGNPQNKKRKVSEMKTNHQKNLWIALCLLASFVVWTVLICLVDVKPIGPDGSSVGFATLNRFVHDLTGVHLSLYTVTDWLGLVPIATALGFAALGLGQWIRRKSLWRVDSDILVLGGFYAVVMAIYAFFEVVVINTRPVLIDGSAEASYPSSTTLLVLCVMPTAAMQLWARIKSRLFKGGIVVAITVFTVLMVVLRLLSGVHWITDIIGGAILSAALTALYQWLTAKSSSPYFQKTLEKKQSV